MEPAEVDPVARVLVDIALAHLDRPFDYAVPTAMAETAVPGARVKVRFAGQDVDGYVVERASHTDHTGALQPLRRVVSPEPVLAPEIVDLSEALARRYAGARSDVLRLAVPPRHAATEKVASERAPEAPAVEAPTTWSEVAHADAYLRHLASGGSPRAVWAAAPGDDWPAMVAEAVATTYAAGRGALVCVPDRRDVARVDAALADRLGEGHHVCLTADGGPAARYRDFLAVSRGARRIVVGTRSAAFAPVHDLGLVVLWDDGDDLHAEPRAPYPHTREVLLVRAEQQGTAALLGGVARTPEAEQLVATGWAHELAAPREVLRRARPRRGRPGRGPLPSAPASRARPTTPSGAVSRPGRCSCRRRVPATPRRWPATPAGPPPAARSAPDRWSWTVRRCHRTAGGAATSRRPGRARRAAATGCARRCGARPAPRRSWAGCSPAPPSAAPAASASSTGSATRPTSWSPPSGPSPSPTRATPPSSSSTRG